MNLNRLPVIVSGRQFHGPKKSITPILNELHWLPINKRRQFKILLVTFKSLNGWAPEYLCDMLNVYMPNRSLRSTAFTSLVPYINRSIRLGKHLFGTSAAKLWNELPRNIHRADSMTIANSSGLNIGHLCKQTFTSKHSLSPASVQTRVQSSVYNDITV